MFDSVNDIFWNTPTAVKDFVAGDASYSGVAFYILIVLAVIGFVLLIVSVLDSVSMLTKVLSGVFGIVMVVTAVLYAIVGGFLF